MYAAQSKRAEVFSLFEQFVQRQSLFNQKDENYLRINSYREQ